jgi:plasmid stabilization system protein ParE
MAGRQPAFTENFSANLTAIEQFLGPQQTTVHQRLLDRLFDEVIPLLCRFPHSGRSFLAHTIQSAKARTLAKRLKGLLKRQDDIREFIMDDYLLLYLVRKGQVVFLPIKHHRQLSFDLSRFWYES